jgi:hypothetical protein
MALFSVLKMADVGAALVAAPIGVKVRVPAPSKARVAGVVI